MDPAVQHDAGHRVHLHRLDAGGALPQARGAPFLKHGRILVDEPQRHKLGDAPRLLLQGAQPVQVDRLVVRGLQVAVHYGRGGGQAQPVRRLQQLHPLRGGDPAGRDHVAHRVHENLRGGARQAAQAGLLERGQVVRHTHAGQLRAVQHLLGGAAVDVNPRQRLLYRAHQIDVVPAVHTGGQAGLHAHLGRAQLPGFAGPAHHLFHGQKVALPGAVTAGKGAEPATLHAHVGEVDVAVDHVGDALADRLAPQVIRGGHQGHQLGAPGLEQPRALLDGDFPAFQRPFQDRPHFRSGQRQVEHGRRRCARRPGGRLEWLRHGAPVLRVAREGCPR